MTAQPCKHRDREPGPADSPRRTSGPPPEGTIAAGIAGGAWSNAFSLIRHGNATFGFSLDKAARRRLPRIVIAALLMGGLLWLATSFVLGGAIHGLTQAVVLLALIVAGIAAYGALLTLFGVTSWPKAVQAIRQTRSRDLRA